jgi:NIPSNAP
MHLVDTVEVEPGRVDDYLEVVRTLGLAVMTDAGATFVSCATTSSEIGEGVQVQVVWSFDDHVHWNEIRKNLVLDARYHEYGGALASVRVGGTRRFFTLVAPAAPTTGR